MSLTKQATTGLVWTFAQQFGNQFIGFFVSMILARLLLPAEFGLIGMVAVFIAIGKVLLNSGLTQSIIRSTNLDQEDYSTIFFFNLGGSIIVYFLLFFLAPFVANFYEQNILTGILRLFGISFIISAFSAVQGARLSKLMDFKTQTIIGLPSTVIGGIVGIILAFIGFGVWSLVWSSLASAFVNSVQLWIFSKWTPDFIFNYKKFKSHFNFGYKLMLSGLLDSIFLNIYPLIIGRFFSPSEVGYYTRAQTMKQLPVATISNAINKVTYPMFATIQNDNIRLKAAYRKLIQMLVYVVSPILVFLAILAEPTFRFLFTEKWLPAVPYFQILCVTGILYPLHSYNLNVLKVKGRSDLFLKLEVINKIIILIVIFFALRFGILALIYGQVIISVISLLINTHYSGKFIDYPVLEQMKDILPSLLLAVICGSIVYGIDKFYMASQEDLIRILVGVFCGCFFYLVFSYIFSFKSFNEFKKIFVKGDL